MKRIVQRKHAALLLSVLAAVSFMLFLAFSVHEAGHACTGRDCTVCEILSAGGKTLKETLVPNAEPAMVKAVRNIPVVKTVLLSQVSFCPTPVQKKCRMNL